MPETRGSNPRDCTQRGIKMLGHFEERLKVMKENWDKIVSEDKAAKDDGKLVGRYIKEQIADGFAIYQIVRENKQTVRIKVVTGIGDDWIIPYWGEEAAIDKAYAQGNIEWRDHMDAYVDNIKKVNVEGN